jgi:DNA-binding MarR family transcriptional regulator
MSTEREIIQSCACHKVRMAARAVTRAYDDALRPVGLRATQLSVLVAVAIDGAMSITELANFLGMDRSTLTRNLAPLKKEGLVSVGAEGWRRSRELVITKKGRARMESAVPIWQNAQTALKRKVGERNWGNFHDQLDHVIRMSA